MPIDSFFVSSNLLWATSQEESQVIRDEGKTMAQWESSSEQQIHESADYTLIVRKTGALGLVLLGLTAGRQAGRQIKLS